MIHYEYIPKILIFDTKSSINRISPIIHLNLSNAINIKINLTLMQYSRSLSLEIMIDLNGTTCTWTCTNWHSTLELSLYLRKKCAAKTYCEASQRHGMINLLLIQNNSIIWEFLMKLSSFFPLHEFIFNFKW